MPHKRCAFSDFAFQYIRRRSSCNAMGAFVISPLASLGQTEFLIGPGPSLRARFAARPSVVPHDPIYFLRRPFHFPLTVIGSVSSAGFLPPGVEGLQLTRCRSHHVAAYIPAGEAAVSDPFVGPCCLRALSTVSVTGSSCNEATSAFTVRCNLMLRAYPSSMLSRAPPSCSRATAPPLLRSLSFWLRSDFHRHDSVPFTGHADFPPLRVATLPSPRFSFSDIRKIVSLPM